MSDYSEQKSESNLKIIDKIEVKHRPKLFEKQEGNNVKVTYLHTIMDKVVKDLNDGFVSNLDNILNNSKNSIDQLGVNLRTANSDIDKLVEEVGNSGKGLIKKLNDLQEEIEQLKSQTSDGKDLDIDQGEWDAPQFKGTDTEFI